MNGLFFPYAEYSDEKSALLCVPIGFIPFYRRFFELLQQRSTWADRESWWRGYQLAAESEECLMSGCIDKLLESNDRIYRLLERSLMGTAYVATPDAIDPVNNPPIITPALADVPPALAVAPGLLARVERLLMLTDNLTTGRVYGFDAQNPGEVLLADNNGVRHALEELRGILNPGWFGIGGELTTVADVVNALRIGSQDDKQSLLDTLSTILGAGSDVASIFNAVRGLLGDVVDTASEGAVLGVLIASTLATAAVAGQQQIATAELLTKLDLVLAALRGAAAPADNILQALRGDDPANGDRNLATLLS